MQLSKDYRSCALLLPSHHASGGCASIAARQYPHHPNVFPTLPYREIHHPPPPKFALTLNTSAKNGKKGGKRGLSSVSLED
eukprot:552430-Hanusia_phi.AAC.1